MGIIDKNNGILLKKGVKGVKDNRKMRTAFESLAIDILPFTKKKERD